ncbi:MAG: hypothetical protein KAS61_08010, partial [Spirochaetes bacterium]|nr:hypothetical protein [Spirochaetota bacterium]
MALGLWLDFFTTFLAACLTADFGAAAFFAGDGFTFPVFAAVGDLAVLLLTAVTDVLFAAAFGAAVFVLEIGDFPEISFREAGFRAAVFGLEVEFVLEVGGFRETVVFREDFFPPVPFFADAVDFALTLVFAAVFVPADRAEVVCFFAGVALRAAGFFFALLFFTAALFFFLPNTGQ